MTTPHITRAKGIRTHNWFMYGNLINFRVINSTGTGGNKWVTSLAPLIAVCWCGKVEFRTTITTHWFSHLPR